MSNIAKAFANGKAFIAFLTCGDPDLATTAAAVRAAVQNGADLIELGIPFSDPTAEGPVIQGANLRALQGGVTTDQIFDFVRELRKDVTVPMVFMTYANVVFSYGAEQFISTCRDIGIDGLILPDLPFEEKEEFLPLCRQYGVDLISLIAPTSARHVRIHWTAVRDSKESIHDREQRRLFIRPDVCELEVRETRYFQAVFENVSDQRVRWSVKEPQGGEIDENGMYTAPNTVGVYEIEAQSAAHPELRASTYVVVRDPLQEQA